MDKAASRIRLLVVYAKVINYVFLCKKNRIKMNKIK